MNITEYRALAHEGSDWSEAFQTAVRTLTEQGGGELLVPPGRYFTGPIRLESHITLRIQNGAQLVFHADESKFPLVTMQDRGKTAQVHQACIYACGAENITVTGDGILDGQGSYWWQRFKKGALSYPRPRLICFDHCRHIKIEGVALLNSPSWTVHPLCCQDVTIQGITIHNPWDSPNTDGINPDSCQDVKITDCTVDVGDDCITLKAGTELSDNPPPCERIIITGCHLLHGHGGIVLGSETSGSIRNIVVSNCIFHETDRGIRLKTRRGRGGTVEGLQVFNLIMDQVMCPFVFNMYYFCGPGGKADHVRSKLPMPVDETTPALRDVSISGVSVKRCSACAGFFYGLSEQPVEGITLRDIRVEMDKDAPGDTPAMMDDCPRMAGEGFFLRNATNVRFVNTAVFHLQGALLNADESVSYQME